MNPVLSYKRDCRVLQTDFLKCVFCQSSSTEQLNNLTARGIATFVKAIKSHEDEDLYRRLSSHSAGDDVIDLLDDSNTECLLNLKPRYHVSCRNYHIYQKKGVKQQKTEKSDIAGESTRKRRNQPVDMKSNCFLCEKERDSKGVWNTVLVATKQRQEMIHRKAKEIQDDAILTKIEGYGDTCLDMVAADFRYHQSCIRAFKNRKAGSNIKQQETDAEDIQTEVAEQRTVGPNVYNEAFLVLVDEISDSLIKEKSIYYITQLRDRYREILAERMVPQSMSYKTRRLKKRLIKHFGSSVQIIAQKGQSSIVSSSAITVGELFAMAARLKERVDESTLATESEGSSSSEDEDDGKNRFVSAQHDIYAVGKHVRSELKEKGKDIRKKLSEDTEAENCNDIEVSYEATKQMIPDALYNLIAWIICNIDESEINANGRVELSTADNEKVLNISQDIMACVAKVPMPKHIGLALYVLRQTRSKDIVTVLNRFGHSISYYEAQRYMTAMVQKVELQTIDYGVFVPSNCKVGEFTQYAFDNLDFHEDTKDGSTLHATSHNIYQYPESVNIEDKCTIPKKTRSFTLHGPVVGEFYPPESNLSLKDRRAARSIKGIKVSDTEDDGSILQDKFVVLTLLRRQISTDDSDTTPVSWNTFCEMSESSVKDKTTIAYGPLFPQSPTNPDVVQASLDYFMSLTKQINQNTTIVTCDQAIYDIVKGITNKNPVKYKSLVVRLGGFHIIENFLGAVGHFMKGSGIEDILADSGVCLKGTINKVMAGKDYYKMIRCHSLMCEAIINVMWNSFEDWLEKENEGQNHMIDLYLNIYTMQEDIFNNDSLELDSHADSAIQNLCDLTPMWKRFHDQLGATGKFWVMYIEMILIAKRYVYAERAGLWQNHLKETRNMLPYLVSAGHTKYMSCLPLYLKEMEELPEKHPDVFQKFEEGKFTVHQIPGPFNGVWTDLALEQTYNREGKTSLLKGISQSSEARNKYIQTVPAMTKVSEAVKSMVHMDTPISKHHGESVLQSKEDLQVVIKIQDCIIRSMIDPFSSDTDKTVLVNIVTGEKAHSVDLISVKEKGLEAIKAAERNETDKIEVPKITSFVQKKSKTPSNKGLIQLYQDESSVTRALCFIQGADEETRNEAFSHEWCQYPPSMFKPDNDLKTGFAMIKSTKSDFLTCLFLKVAGKVAQPQELPPSLLVTTYLIDTMAFIQRYRKMKAKTFKELAEQYIQKMLQCLPTNCTNLNIVGDRYDFSPTESMKGDERERRELKHEQGREYIMKDSLDIPDWDELISNANNKGTLLKYFSNCLCQNAETLIPENIIAIIGGLFETRSRCVAIRNSEVVEIPALSCEQHEEADTRIIAHLAYCADTLGYKRAVIACTDTDIIMLAMYHFCFLPLEQLWIQKNDSFIPIHDMVHALSEKCEKPPKQVIGSLLCAYVLSGCDTTSYFFRKGKRKAANTALDLVENFPNMSQFGLAMDGNTLVAETIVDEARHFVATLYGKGGFKSLDLLRQHIFPSGTDLRLMPPTEDAFHQHLLRCLYQLLIYHRARSSQLKLPSPTEFGRKSVQGRLCPVMITKTPKPPNVKNSACKCKSTHCLRNCSCARNKLMCFVGCLCLGNRETCGRMSFIADDIEGDDADDY